MDPKKWTNGIRQLVSKKKRRHKEMGFDLDLSYVTSRIIAMGFPSTGNEGLYRNHADHVTEFLQIKHGAKVKVYNLCSERDYPVSLFDGRVSKYPFDDHNPPPMQMFLPFCEDVMEWLEKDDENVVAIHCKAGKGRTGVMICAYLVYSGEWENPDECMAFYGFARTHNGKGVTIPSQKRFIRYFAELCHDKAITSKTDVGKHAPEGHVEENDAFDNEEKKSTGNESSSESEHEKNMSLVAVDNAVPLCDEVEVNTAEESLSVNVNSPNIENQNDRPVVVTPKGSVFKDYTSGGSGLAENLDNARKAAKSSKGRRPTYAQASFWMTSHREMVHQIFLESGVPGGLLGTDHVESENSFLALEDGSARESLGQSERLRGQVFPAVVLAVVEMRLSAVPSLNLRGAFEPIFRIQSAGHSIWSTDYLPRSIYRGEGAITFAIPGVHVVDEVLFTLYHRTNFGKEKIGQFWLHTAFIKDKEVVLKKSELDKICKDKHHKKYPSDFSIRVSFDDVTFEQPSSETVGEKL